MPQISDQDRDMIIRTVVGEADDQSPEGQAAVAHTIMNRLQSGQYGRTASDVVTARGQFAPWGQPTDPDRVKEIATLSPSSKQYQRVGAVVDGVLSGDTPDPTSGATHFLDPVLQKQWIASGKAKGMPDWAQGPGISIGSHTFYNPNNPSYGGNGLDAINAAVGAGGTPRSFRWAWFPMASILTRRGSRLAETRPTSS